MKEEIIITGKWTVDFLNSLLYKFSIYSISSRISSISYNFLGTQYRENTLIGDINTPERFVINLEAVDCLTFIEYVEAMRLSSTFDEFKDKLQHVRYRNKEIDFKKRNHFFTDWIQYNSLFVRDVTKVIGGNNTVFIDKTLNIKEDGTTYLNGISPVMRKIAYIPSKNINNNIIDGLKTGDYIGIYSDNAGLDVSHVGIFIKKGKKALLRHASSEKNIRMVIDEDFKSYIAKKLGITIIRAWKG